MIQNKRLLFVVTAVLFIIYTLGVIFTTLEIGFDVMRVEPNWLAVGVAFALMFTTMLPAYVVIYLAVLEDFKRRAVLISLEPVPEFADVSLYQDYALRQMVNVFGISPDLLTTYPREVDDGQE